MVGDGARRKKEGTDHEIWGPFKALRCLEVGHEKRLVIPIPYFKSRIFEVSSKIVIGEMKVVYRGDVF